MEVQTNVAPSLPSLPPNKVNKAQAMEELLRNVKKEMIETEKDFYGQMDLLATRFLPLVKQVGVVKHGHTHSRHTHPSSTCTLQVP